MWLRALLAAFAGLAVSTAPEADECGEPPPDSFGANGCLLDLGHPDVSFLHGVALDKVIRALGEPKSKQIRRGPDPYEPEIAVDHVELSYPDSRIQLRCSTSATNCWIETFETSNFSSDLGCGLRLGQPVQRFVDKLGLAQDSNHPSRKSKRLEVAWDHYWCERGVWFGRHATITLHPGAANSVERISWYYFAD